jgi:hypothetical protein
VVFEDVGGDVVVAAAQVLHEGVTVVRTVQAFLIFWTGTLTALPARAMPVGSRFKT